MPRVTTVAKARKNAGTCEKCGTEIKKGDSYKWWKFRFGGKHVRCSKTECVPRPSDLTQSAFLGTLADLQTNGFTGDTIDDLESERDNIVSELESLRDEQEEKKSNMPDSLQESATGELLQERYDALDEAVNELSGIDISLEDDEPEKEEDETDETFKERQEKFEEAKQEKIESIKQELQDVLDNISCS